MRLTLYTAALSLILFSACNGDKKDLEIYSPTAIETNEEAANALIKALSTGGSEGWNADIRTGSGQEFIFNFQFGTDGQVSMNCDCNIDQIMASNESTYAVSESDGTILSFTNYSYLHQLVDTRPEIMGGTAGKGLISDVEFKLISQNDQEIVLKGLKNNTTLRLKKTDVSFASLFEKEIEDYKEVLKLPTYVNDGLVHLNRTADNSRLYRFKMDEEEGTVQILVYQANGTGNPSIQSPRTKPEDGMLFFASPVYLGGDELGGLRYNKELEKVQFLKNNTWTALGNVEASELIGDLDDNKVWRISRWAANPELDVDNDFLTLFNKVRTDLQAAGFTYDRMTTEFLYGDIYIMLRSVEGGSVRMYCNYNSDGDNFDISSTGIDLGTDAQNAALKPLADYFMTANFRLKWSLLPGGNYLFPVFYDINNENFAMYNYH